MVYAIIPDQPTILRNNHSQKIVNMNGQCMQFFNF